LTASSNVTWGNLASVPSSLALNAGASTQITIHVAVPLGTPVGTDGHFTIKATSTTNSGIQDTGDAVVTSLTATATATASATATPTATGATATATPTATATTTATPMATSTL